MAFFDASRTGELLSRLSADTALVQVTTLRSNLGVIPSSWFPGAVSNTTTPSPSTLLRGRSQVATTVTFPLMCKFFLQFTGGTVALLIISWRLTLVMIAPIPILGAVYLWCERVGGWVRACVRA